MQRNLWENCKPGDDICILLMSGKMVPCSFVEADETRLSVSHMDVPWFYGWSAIAAFTLNRISKAQALGQPEKTNAEFIYDQLLLEEKKGESITINYSGHGVAPKIYGRISQLNKSVVTLDGVPDLDLHGGTVFLKDITCIVNGLVGGGISKKLEGLRDAA